MKIKPTDRKPTRGAGVAVDKSDRVKRAFRTCTAAVPCTQLYYIYVGNPFYMVLHYYYYYNILHRDHYTTGVQIHIIIIIIRRLPANDARPRKAHR